MCASLWAIFSAVDAMAGMIAKSVVLALTELAYFGVWIIGVFVLLFVVRFAVSLLFTSKNPEIETLQPIQTPEKEGDVIINVQRGSGFFGAQSSPAQQIISNRQ